MRLEVLELIQLQVESLEEEAQHAAAMHSTDDRESAVGESKEGATVSASAAGSSQPIVVPENVAFEDIMDTAQELRVLVSKRGMEGMLVGTLLSIPSALVPLQDVEDMHNITGTDGKATVESAEGKAIENNNPNALAPMTPGSAVKIRFADKKSAKKEAQDKKPKKVMQTSALIACMEVTAKELAAQVHLPPARDMSCFETHTTGAVW
jgi:hypothetical protein